MSLINIDERIIIEEYNNNQVTTDRIFETEKRETTERTLRYINITEIPGFNS